jgi:beta-N-acetylhexosaminidase
LVYAIVTIKAAHEEKRMQLPHTPVSRRSILVAGAAIGALGVTGRATAAPSDDERHGLTAAQQAGQRVIFSYPGATPPESLLAAIRAGEVGGVIFFGENIKSLAQIAGVVAALREANAQSPVRAPLLLMTDQEGGKVRRLPGEPVLSAKQVGASADPAATAAAAGTGAGQNLAGVGMNVNLAPVLDVFRVPGNFDDQFGRSFSSDPTVCATCGAAFITAQQSLGIAATAKHFPGLGAAAANQNTDLTKVVLDVPADELRTVDELPFRAAIGAGVDMVMTSWAVYPALDPDLPAGFSRTIVQGELRHRLKFRGVTITDALEAGSLAEYGDSGQRGVLAAAAGMDVLLCSARDVAQGQETVAALADVLRRHAQPPGRSDGALRRVLALRSRLA